MKTLLSAFVLVLLAALPVSANQLAVDLGLGVFKSERSGAMFLRYQKDTSRLFDRPSYWEGVAGYWTNSNWAVALGVARGIDWNRGKRDHFYSTSFGLASVNRTTNHLGTHFQFYFRQAYHVTMHGRDISLGLTHISNGKLVFRWNGPNSGENFLTLSVGFP
jgi:hypothetical protein